MDHLVAKGLRCLTVLDVSGAALNRAKARLGEQANQVQWIETDVTGEWTIPPVDVWHDRAAFHFLTEAEDRARYVAHLRKAVKHGGTVIMVTYALDGPKYCSGLPVCRYNAAGIGAELGEQFILAETVAEAHQTPIGAVQSFSYSKFVRDL